MPLPKQDPRDPFAPRLDRRRLLLGLSAAVLWPVPAVAHEYLALGFRLIHPWADPCEAGAAALPVYFTLEDIEAGDVLLGALAPWAEAAELRQPERQGGEPLPRIAIPAGAAFDAGPGGAQLRLLRPRLAVQAGRSYPLTLRFAQAGPVTVMLSVGAH